MLGLSEMPSWAVEWAAELSKQHNHEHPQARSRSPVRKNLNPQVAISGEGALPSVEVLLDKAKTAAFLQERMKMTAEECNRVVKPGPN